MTLPSQAGRSSPFSGRTNNLMARAVEYVLQKLLSEQLDGALTIVLPNGHAISIGSDVSTLSAPILKLNDYRVLRQALRRGGLAFGEAYISGGVECSDLDGVLRFYLRNRQTLDRIARRYFRVLLLDRLAHVLRRNTLSGSRRNISDHYDLGNEFYAAWLDPGMNYSSGLYRDSSVTLETAQLTKLDRIRGLVAAQPNQTILEIGCGWGAYACRTAQLDGVFVTGITLSQEQMRYARELARQKDLDGQCDFQLRDYRHVDGEYDHIVSIEMIEAVGESYWNQYFRILHDRLKSNGSVTLQAITLAPQFFESYRRRPDFIQRYIFPGGMLPTTGVIETKAEQAGFRLVHSENFGPSYAQTLNAWRTRFEKSWVKISQLGFDDRFRRRWQYYFAYCKAGFESGAIDVGLYKLIKK